MITDLGGWLKNQKIMSTWFLNDPLICGLYRKYPKIEKSNKRKSISYNPFVKKCDQFFNITRNTKKRFGIKKGYSL